jgi:hypothetical protein
MVAQDGIWSNSEQRSPQHGLSCGLPGEDGVDTSLKSLPSAATHPASHRARTDVAALSLSAGNRITLHGYQLA